MERSPSHFTRLSERFLIGKILVFLFSILKPIKFRVQFIREAIQDIEEASCLDFEDITDSMDDYMKGYEIVRRLPKYFTLKSPPDKYPNYI